MDRQKASHQLPSGKVIGCRPCLAQTLHGAGFVPLHNGHHLGPRKGNWHQLVLIEPRLAWYPGSPPGVLVLKPFGRGFHAGQGQPLPVTC